MKHSCCSLSRRLTMAKLVLKLLNFICNNGLKVLQMLQNFSTCNHGIKTWCIFVSLCQDDRKFAERREDEGMGKATITNGETLVYLQHRETGLWLSYQTFETKKRGVGRVEEKKASGILMSMGRGYGAVANQKFSCVIPSYPSLLSCPTKSALQSKTSRYEPPVWTAAHYWVLASISK